MSLVRVASLKPSIQNKVIPLIKQAKSGQFRSGKEAVEYYVLGSLLRREKTDMKDFHSLASLLRAEKLVDVEFDDITLLSWEFTAEPSRLKDSAGIINLKVGSLGVRAKFNIVIMGKMSKDHQFTKNTTKRIEFTWSPSLLFAMSPPIISRILEAEGYQTNYSMS